MTNTTQSIPQSFTQFLQGQTLQEALLRAQDVVKHRPADVTARWGLFELLCLLSDWTRALKQLQTCVQLDKSLEPTAQMLRDLIRAETQRKAVWLGEQLPVPVVDMPQWMGLMAQALMHHANKNTHEEDQARSQALSLAPSSAGRMLMRSAGDVSPAKEHRFEWVTDTDTRLGPVCELVVAGSYRWLSYSDVARMNLRMPSKLLDLIWLPVEMHLRHSPLEMNVFIPVRYPETLPAQLAGGVDDALLLARLTQWQELGETGVYAQGQKVLMTQLGDWPLLDIAQIHFDKEAA